MNKGTIIRTILAIGSVLNEAAVVSGIAAFNNPTLDQIYQIVSFIFMVLVLFINTYYNNDYTEEACIGTGMTRLLKEQKKLEQKGGSIIGEDFGEDLNNEFEGI